MVWLGLLAAAWGAQPCYGFAHPNRLEGTHFWVEWPDGAISPIQAQGVLYAAEHAHDVYAGLGWPITDDPVSIAILREEGEGISGITQTVDCAGVPQPRIELTVSTWPADGGLSITAHEVGHVAQYGYMGDYLDSVASWVWWMEGTAEWLETFATENPPAWGRSAGGWLRNPWVALHQGPQAYLVPERNAAMYGTSYLARYIEEQYGADKVRQTWEWAAPQTGTVLYFPDAIEGVGIPFDPFWARFLAASTVVDFEWGEYVDRRISAVDIEGLPAQGEPEPGFFPEGLGVTAVHFAAVTGGPDKALQIAFDGDSEVEWIAVIVRTEGDRPDGKVIDYVPLDLDAGAGTGWLTGFDGSVDGWLVASPISADQGPFLLSWEAFLVDDPGPMDGVIPFDGEPEEPEGCGCNSTATPTLPLALGLLLLTRRRNHGSGGGLPWRASTISSLRP